jgi:hypothetical protein
MTPVGTLPSMCSAPKGHERGLNDKIPISYLQAQQTQNATSDLVPSQALRGPFGAAGGCVDDRGALRREYRMDRKDRQMVELSDLIFESGVLPRLALTHS